ncbi:hypothetical protein [Butyrivibrio sp. AE3004]|uniref:hypothetical protein n=1 Tax=Butyrivibrio sp. AE3004 TaxID=1506994 RepID=UPI000494436D|nr:hypothetical protein [Butyrivibrio sp. AE3004]
MSLFIMNGIGYESIKSQVDISGPISVIVLYGLYIAAIVFIKKKNLQDSDKKPQAELKEVV